LFTFTRRHPLVILAISLAVMVFPLSGAHAAATKIISLSPSATEILYGIGAGSHVVAVDSLSNYPSTAPITKLDAYSPNIEAISAYQPDLVILNDSATKAQDVKAGLEALGIKVYFEHTPSTIAGAYQEMTELGKVTGRSGQASALISSMKKKIASIIRKAKVHRKLAFFHEVDKTLFTATSQTFIGSIYKDFGLINIADAASQSDGSGYPQLQSEFVIKSNPSIIFLGDAQYGESRKTVAGRAGWSGISAVKKRNVFALPNDIPSRWGPRLVDFYQFVATSIGQSK
jgi:iron complex transport system substrate-binding protein